MTFEDKAFKVTDLNIDGHDIMNLTKLQSGILIGEILKRLLDIVIEFPELNTKSDLTRIVETKLKIEKENGNGKISIEEISRING